MWLRWVKSIQSYIDDELHLTYKHNNELALQVLSSHFAK